MTLPRIPSPFWYLPRAISSGVIPTATRMDSSSCRGSYSRIVPFRIPMNEFRIRRMAVRFCSSSSDDPRILLIS